MTEQHTAQPTYDFERAFSFNSEVFPQFLEHFLDSEDFQFTVEEVIPNTYIQVGESPTGIRDLQFSLKVRIMHLPTGTEQLLTKTEPDEPFTVVK